MHKQFHQENNRLQYGSLISPPDGKGMKLSYAVGMTYSLDLEALLSVPVSFGVLETPDTELLRDPIVVLEAIRRCSNQITLFCNVDGIKLPQEIRPVYSLLENSVVPVNLGAGCNFHPKMWVIRYENDEEEIIRIIILSRNLTFDRSMDIAVEMTGVINRDRIRLQKKHQPIADMLEYLAGVTGDVKKKVEIEKLAKDVLYIGKFEIDDQYEDYEFLPVGIPGYTYETEKRFSDASSILIVSPFLTRSVLEKITENASRRTLISRVSSVTKDIYAMFDKNIYVPRDGLENDNSLEEGEDDDAPKRDLHAKIIYTENGDEKDLFLGSLNATANAFYHNIEMMLKLRFRPTMASFNQVKADLLGDEYGAFKELKYEPELETAEDSEEMSDFSDIASVIKGARVIGEAGVYCTEVFTDLYKGIAEIKPLFMKGDFKRLKDNTRFERMTIKELSEFFVVRKQDQIRVLKVETEGFPREERDNAVFNSIIDTKPKVMQFILFLLADDPAMALVENDEFIRSLSGKTKRQQQELSPPIYEKMLLTAAREPEKFKAVKDVLRRVDRAILGDDETFRNMLDAFMKAVEVR